MKNKKLIITAAALLALVAVLLGVYFATRPQTSQGSKNYTVTVVHGDGSTKDFHYATEQKYLGPALLEAGLVEGEQGEYGLYIKTVDGEDAIYEVDGSYWSLYIGESYATTGVDQTPVHDGDSFRLVRTSEGG